MPMQMTPRYQQLLVSQQTDLLLLPPLTGTWLRFRSGAITAWCMILNPNKTKALMVNRSRTVNPPHGDLVLPGVSICASPNLDILCLKFASKLTIEDHVHGIVYRVSQKISILRLVKRIFLLTALCYFVSIMNLFSQSLSVVLRCEGRLLNVTFSSRAPGVRRQPDLALIRVSCHCVITLCCWILYVAKC